MAVSRIIITGNWCSGWFWKWLDRDGVALRISGPFHGPTGQQDAIEAAREWLYLSGRDWPLSY